MKADWREGGLDVKWALWMMDDTESPTVRLRGLDVWSQSAVVTARQAIYQ